MKRRSFLATIPGIILVAMGLLAMGMLGTESLFAQSGSFELLRAEYGAGDTWVDVTARVASLVRDESLNIRVDNETLGGDPTPGRHKTLRLRVRDESGRVSVLSYGEKDVIGMTIRREGRRRGDRGPEERERREARGPAEGEASGLQIIRAEYGTDQRYANVSARLASRIHGDRLSLRVTNDAMGGDPAEDHRKTLTVWYRYNGRTASATVGEGDDLNLPGDSDYFQGNLRILRAQYGAGHRYADVTELLNSQIQDDRLSLRVTNETMGGDPAEDIRKQLSVSYLYNGQQFQVVVEEKEDLNLPGSGTGYDGGSRGGLQILQATYGAGDRVRDVSERLNAQVSGDQLQMQVSNATMGGDPAEGQHKRLRVVYLWQGLRYQAIALEGETIVIP
jgi:hypothetical protein